MLELNATISPGVGISRSSDHADTTRKARTARRRTYQSQSWRSRSDFSSAG